MPLENCSPRLALELAAAMCGMFKPDRETDELAFVKVFARLFELYPEEVGRTVADPINGLPSRLKFFPAIAEVKAACEEAFAPEREWREREAARQDHYRRFPLLNAPGEPLAPLTVEDRERIVAEWEYSRRFDTADPLEIARQTKIREVEADARLLTLRGAPLPKLGLGALRVLVRTGHGDFELPRQDELRLIAEAELQER